MHFFSGDLNLKVFGQANDEVQMTTERHFKHYEANENRIALKERLLFQNYYEETGSVKYYQNLIPRQLVSGVHRSLHGEFGKHPGISTTRNAYREKIYYPNMAHLIKKLDMSCEQGVRESRNDHRLSHSSLQKPNEYITVPDDATQVDLLPDLPPSGSFERNVTGMDVFSRYLVAYPTTSRDAETIVKVVFITMILDALLPLILISDRRSGQCLM